jgi:hypothetical protein
MIRRGESGKGVSGFGEGPLCFMIPTLKTSRRFSMERVDMLSESESCMAKVGYFRAW